VIKLNFELMINECKNEILKDNLEKVETLIDEAFKLNNNSPKIHNILGVLSEIKRDKALAIKHYRAALGLDPSYKPAIKNLENITSFEYYFTYEKLYFDEDVDNNEHKK
jgi:tetratricopeptide (TPR) repeat protein